MDHPSAVYRTRIEIPPSVWISSLWMRVGFVGLMVAAWAVAAALEAFKPSLMVVFVASVALAGLAFRRTFRALDGEAGAGDRPATRPDRAAARPA